jgi:hypothetical protein
LKCREILALNPRIQGVGAQNAFVAPQIRIAEPSKTVGEQAWLLSGSLNVLRRW